MYDYCVVGGGIVGLATALSILKKEPDARILIVEKEQKVGAHQTSHNSGVIHAGIYYPPKSFKAKLCRAGERATKDFCNEHNIKYRVPGKLVVATNEKELKQLNILQDNAAKNGIICKRLGNEALNEAEPAITGLGALLVEQSGIVDYAQISQVMAKLITDRGGEIIYNAPVTHFEERSDCVRIHSANEVWESKYAIACAGLQADRLAKRSGLNPDFQIIPFRGEYYALRAELSTLTKHMIYPVPDPSLPFLGIHLTPMINGQLTVGPNAVLGLSREGYPKFSLNLSDIATYLRYPGFWKVISSHFGSGLSELKDSLSKRSYLEKCRKYCPSLKISDLEPFRAGIRAQAVSKDGKLIHDFKFLRTKRSLHVCNAPSPAATSAIPIGEYIFKHLHSGP